MLSLVKPSITLATGVFCCAIHAYVYDLRFDNHDDDNPDNHDDNPDNHDDDNPDNHDDDPDNHDDDPDNHDENNPDIHYEIQGGELVCAWLCDGHLRSFGRPRAGLEPPGITLLQ